MKKILIFILFTLLLTSCFGGEEKVEENVSAELLKIEQENKIISESDNLVNNQKFDKAIPELAKMYNDDSKSIENILNYMGTLLAKGSIERKEKEYSKKVIEIGNKALLDYPKNSEIYRHIGYAYEIAEDYTNAFKNYDKSIEINSKNALAYSNRGHAYKLFGNYEKAEKDLKSAYELDKTTDHILINLAGIYVLRLKDEKAIELFDKVINTTKNIRFKSEAAYSVGNLLLNKNKYNKAEEYFKKSIEADSKFELGYLGLGKLQFLKATNGDSNLSKEKKGELIKEALKNNDMAISLNPNRALSFVYKGLMLKDLSGFETESELILKFALDVLKTDITLSKIEKDEMEQYINNNK